jgi:glycosyltransferase involved in cell wall biosynthesis
VIRVGFVLQPGAAEWLGGLNYIRNLIQALAAAGHGVVEPVLIVSPAESAALAQLPAVEVLRTPLVNRRTREGALRLGVSLTLERDPFLDGFLRRHGIQVLSHSNDLGRHAATPVIAWIPDFQHVHLPAFFSRRERLARHYYFRRLFRLADTVILSSESARVDARAFLGRDPQNVRVLRFAVRPREAVTVPREALETRYGFRGPFFHLPNQFWVHKNHRLVIDALALLRQRGLTPLVLATGAQEDYRRPRHFQELMEHCRRQGVDTMFRPLGVVPYEDLLALMQAAVAVINPSLAEGWSTTVEEAKALGQRVVLSDLAVHREQAPPGARYFDPRRPDVLAGILEELWGQGGSSDVPATSSARESAATRYAQFAATYEQIVVEALEKRR